MSDEKPTPTGSTAEGLKVVAAKVEKAESSIDMLWSTAKKLVGTNAVVVGIFAVVVAGFALRSRDSLAQSNQAQIDAGIKPVKDKVDATAEALAQHLLDDRQDKRDIKQSLAELALDVRAQYRAQQTGQPQARLERPPLLPDGGP